MSIPVPAASPTPDRVEVMFTIAGLTLADTEEMSRTLLRDELSIENVLLDDLVVVERSWSSAPSPRPDARTRAAAAMAATSRRELGPGVGDGGAGGAPGVHPPGPPPHPPGPPAHGGGPPGGSGGADGGVEGGDGTEAVGAAGTMGKGTVGETTGWVHSGDS